MLLFKGGVSKNISIDNILIFLGHADIGDYASDIAANAPLVFTDLLLSPWLEYQILCDQVYLYPSKDENI